MVVVWITKLKSILEPIKTRLFKVFFIMFKLSLKKHHFIVTVYKKKTETCNGLFVQILLLVTRKLESQLWKYDVTISLAALELISGLAEVKVFLICNEQKRLKYQK